MWGDYFPVHLHSAQSVMDGMNPVRDGIFRVAELGMPAASLTDHGTMAGVVQGYKAAQKAGIAFFPGCEWYLVRDVHDPDTRDYRYHLGMLALDFKGYQAMVKLQTLSWQKDRFHRKPLIDLSDLAFLKDEGYAEHLAVTTGCYSGLVVNQWQGPGPEMHALNMIRVLQQWFPHLYVELQNHGIDWPQGVSDGDIANTLYQHARALGLPVVVGADSHYVHPHEQPVHDLMKDICYFGDGEDLHFSGGPYHIEGWSEIANKFPTYMLHDIEAGHSDLLDKHAVKIPALDKFKFHVPAMIKDRPDLALRAKVLDGLRAKGLDTPEYEARVDEECNVIHAMGMDNYFLLVKTHVTDWCRANDIIINTRGSANGSLVCYALGITTVDPLVWNTSFPRFLSLERMKPPDIDIDVDFRGRQRLIDHLRAVFPTMVGVGTYAKIGMGTDKDTGEENGSVIVQYMAAMSRRDPKFDKRIKQEHKSALYALADTVVYKSMGRNAAGFILPGEDHPIDQYLPLGRIISSDTTVTQYSKDDVEALGYVKIDVLGLRALQTLNGTLVRIGKQPNDWDWIPYDDPETCKTLRSGNGTGLFQFEGFSTSSGGKEMKIKSTLDVILCLALYRPALMNGGQKDQYLANRGLKVDRKGQPLPPKKRLPALFSPIVADTLGVPLYQEQIMQMLQMVGMQYAEYNELMTAIKASNGFIAGAADTFKRLMPLFYDLCEDKGLTPEECDEAWHAVIGFTEYGFNRAHSTSYGLMAYFSAYLKTHYPLEYMASLLDVWAEVPDKVRLYTAEARRYNFSIVRADVNYSKVSWDIDTTRRNALRKGLVSLDGIGEPTAEVIVREREANGPFVDVQDFIDRTPRRPVTGGRDWKSKGTLVGVCRTLMETGAFRTIMP